MNDSSRNLPARAEVAVFDSDGQLRTLADIKTEVIDHAFGVCAGRPSEIAKHLGIARSTLYRRRLDPRRS
jgi:transcriptional regulator of acetoin/glycerol metabolism